MLDLHVLVTRDCYLFKNCVSSIKRHEIPARLIPAKGISVLKGRLSAFTQSENQFVSFIDDDDTVRVSYQTLTELCQATPVFTNSYKVNYSNNHYGKSRTLNPPIAFDWSLQAEKDKLITPHQIIIYPKSLAIKLINETAEIIAKNSWDENDCDFVMRLLCSVNVGWKYSNLLAYNWIVNSTSIHKQRPYLKTLEIKKYFGFL